MDEYLDIVNEKDEVIGRELRSVVYAAQRSDFRVINAFLRNSEGKLWIPRRAAHKKIFPLSLDMSVGGHVESGETYDETFRREAAEELNIDIDTLPYRFLGHLTPHQDGLAAFMQVYEIQSDESPQYNPDDFIDYFWMTPKEVIERIEAGEKTKGDLPKLIKKFYV